MQKYTSLAALVFLFLSFSFPGPDRFADCLPQDVKLTDVVRDRTSEPERATEAEKKITLKKRLRELKARCKEGKLVTSSGKPIHIYRLAGCWGNQPADLQEILERERKEIAELKKQYLVIEIECVPSRQTQ